MILCSKNFKSFLKYLTDEQVTPKVSARAIQCIAADIELGRMALDVNVPKNRELPNGEEHHLELYNSPDGCAGEPSHETLLHTGDGGTVRFYFYGASDDTEWGEEIKHELDVVAEVLQLHCARFRLAGMVQHAALTQYMSGLPNSGGYLKRVGELFARCRAADYDAYYFNIRGMSLFNVKYGQREGDEIIRRYGRLLFSSLDDDEAMGHLGGDNFTAFIKKANVKKFEAMLEGVETWVMRGDEKETVIVSATVGVMRLDETVAGPWMVMSGPLVAFQNARQSMNQLVVLTQEMVERSNRVQQVENAFRRGLVNDEFHPFYQPKVNMLNGEIVGAEVLARWIIDGTTVPPGEFIPVLERTGEIAELDLHMLDKACRAMKAWKDGRNEVIPLSVNISRRDLDIPNLSERIIEYYDRYELERKDIIIEVTETENARESSVMMDFLNELAGAGIKTSIDDFGTGYSSLSFLRDFPVGEIKIDRSFINHEKLRSKDRIIIGSIIDMACQLGVDVITEGVEVRDQVDFLLELNCNRAQGFLYDRPLPKETFEKRLMAGPYRV